MSHTAPLSARLAWGGGDSGSAGGQRLSPGATALLGRSVSVRVCFFKLKSWFCVWLQSGCIEIHQTSALRVLKKHGLAGEEGEALCFYQDPGPGLDATEELLSQAVVPGLLSQASLDLRSICLEQPWPVVQRAFPRRFCSEKTEVCTLCCVHSSVPVPFLSK